MLIFTSDFERRYFQRFAPWVRGRSALIPIGSNVPLALKQGARQPNVVTHFGLIRPKKGLEEVLAMARVFKERKNGLSVRIVGTVLPDYGSYYALLRNEAQDLPIEWMLDLEGEHLARVLAQTEVAYLPFPDGASERRGSLIAMLTNSVAVITTRGPQTPSAMEGAVLLTGDPSDAATIAEGICCNYELRGDIQAKAAEYSLKFAWDEIVAQHLVIYQRLIEKG